jgi:hypothetical protein
VKANLGSQISWFVDFANTDLDNADIGQLSKLRAELAQIFLCGNVERLAAPWDEVQYRELNLEIENRYFGTRDKIKNLQQIFLSNIEKITGSLERIAEKAEIEWTPYDDSQTLSGIDLISFKVHLNLEIKMLFRPSLEYKSEAGASKIRWAQAWPLKSNLQVLTLPDGNPEDVLLYAFYRLLEAVPLTTAFRRCGNCGKVFFHISKRERNYCSNLCAAKAGNKKRREVMKESDPALYRQELNRENQRAKKSYEKRVREKHPKAIIKSRKSTKAV